MAAALFQSNSGIGSISSERSVAGFNPSAFLPTSSPSLTDEEMLCLAEEGLFGLATSAEAIDSDHDSHSDSSLDERYKAAAAKIGRRISQSTSRTAANMVNVTVFRRHNQTHFN